MFRRSYILCAKISLRPQGRIHHVASTHRYNRPHLCMTMDTRHFSDSTNTNNDKVKEVVAKSGGRFKEIFQKYGYVAVGTYLGLYVMTLSGLFVALDYDLLAASSMGFDPITTTKSVS